jgi:SAM-dependent methyltransferase
MKALFVESVADALLADGTLNRSDSVLAVCAGLRERDLLAERGFSHVVISNLERDGDVAPFDWSRQDVQDLHFETGSFDFALVVAGLPHCASPHRGLVEMYRVARKGIVVVESRDGALLRLATRLGLSSEYELDAVIANEYRKGGVDNTEIPNFIYRWTEAELRKVIRSADPRGEPTFRFFYSLDVPQTGGVGKIKRSVVAVAAPTLTILAGVFPKLANTMAMVALHPQSPWPWLRREGAQLVFDRRYVEQRGGASSE